jgi:hypothetical protein
MGKNENKKGLKTQDIEPKKIQAGMKIKAAEDLTLVCELGCLKACEIFFKKNIETFSCSANKNNNSKIPPNIIIYYDTLSEENQKKIKKNQITETKQKRKIAILSVEYNEDYNLLENEFIKIATFFETQ